MVCTEYYSRYREVSAAIPGDYGTALFLRLWDAFEGAWRDFFLSFLFVPVWIGCITGSAV